jgi:triosephosphate isomerase
MPVNSKLIDTIAENNKNLKELRIYYGGTVSEESILNLIQRIPC